jgi:hypothetical protein
MRAGLAPPPLFDMGAPAEPKAERANESAERPARADWKCVEEDEGGVQEEDDGSA